jgi:hypothetical protein
MPRHDRRTRRPSKGEQRRVGAVTPDCSKPLRGPLAPRAAIESRMTAQRSFDSQIRTLGASLTPEGGQGSRT